MALIAPHLVPIITASSLAARKLRTVLTDANTTGKNMAFFGDSQETSPGGAGLELIPWINSYLCALYGQSPATQTTAPTSSTIYGGAVNPVGLIQTYDSAVTINSATTTTIVANDLGGTDDYYNDWYISTVISDVYYTRRVTDWVSATKTMTLDTALPSTPSGSFYITLADPVTLPPNIYPAINYGSNDLGMLVSCKPDNSTGGGAATDLATDANVQPFPLPAVPASLTTSHSFTLRAMVWGKPGATDILVESQPHSSKVNAYYQTTQATSTLLAAAAIQSREFVAGTCPLVFAANKPYLQALIRSTTPTQTTSAPIVCARIEVPDGKGIVCDSYSQGGYRLYHMRNKHGSMGDFFDAWVQYHIAVVAVGVNDIYNSMTAADFETSLALFVTQLRTQVAPEVIILWAETPIKQDGSANDAQFLLLASACANVANATPNDVIAINGYHSAQLSGESQANIQVGGGAFAWSAATTYAIGDLVWNESENPSGTAADGKLYLAKTAHTNQRPPNGTHWEDRTWRTGVGYVAGDYVSFRGHIFICINAHTSASNETVNLRGNWREVSGYMEDSFHHTMRGQKRRAANFVHTLLSASILVDPSDLSGDTFFGPNPATRNFTIRQGSDWQRGPFVFSVAGTEVDISGNSYLCLAKRNLLDEEAAFEIECTITDDGLMLSLSSADGLAVTVGETADARLSKFYYDVRQTNSEGYHDYPLAGRITLHATCSND